MENKIIKNKFGKMFGSGMRGGGYIFFVVGLLVIIGSFYDSNYAAILLGLVFFVVGGYIVFSTNGIMIDINNKSIMEYTKYFGLFERGDWKSIIDFPYVTILSFNISSSTFSRSNRRSAISEKQHQVHLLNAHHTKRKLIHTFLDSKLAIEFAKKIAAELKLETTQYNPPTTRRKGGRK